MRILANMTFPQPRISILAFVSFFYQFQVGIAQTNQSEVLYLNGSELPLAKVIEVSHERNAYDYGLSADWLVSIWLMENGLRNQATAAYFTQCFKAKTDLRPPEWWTFHLVEGVSRANQIDFPEGTLPRPAQGPIKFFPDNLRSDSELYSYQYDSTRVVIGASKDNELGLWFFDEAGSEWTYQSGLQAWCPSFVGGLQPYDGEIKDAAYVASFLESEKSIFVFGMLNKTPFFCGIAKETKETEVCFSFISSVSNLPSRRTAEAPGLGGMSISELRTFANRNSGSY